MERYGKRCVVLAPAESSDFFIGALASCVDQPGEFRTLAVQNPKLDARVRGHDRIPPHGLQSPQTTRVL